MKRLPIKLFEFYKIFISPTLHAISPNSGCRFYPSCSDYGRQAVEKHGLFKGGAKSVWRILRCNPFSKGGIDTI